MVLSSCSVDEPGNTDGIPFSNMVGTFIGQCGDIDTGILSNSEDRQVSVSVFNLSTIKVNSDCSGLSSGDAIYIGRDGNVFSFVRIPDSTYTITYFEDQDSIVLVSKSNKAFTGIK